MPHAVDRRTFLAAAASTCVAAAVDVCTQAPASSVPKTRLILLGVAGGPTPKKAASAPAQVILVGDRAYLVDCGDGVARQLTLAGVPFTALRHVFVTHHHSDHNADYGNLFLLLWASGLKDPVDSWGPPPLASMTKTFLELNATDIETRIADEGRVALAPLIRPHEITEAGIVTKDDRVTVTCALAHHPPFAHAFAYRFDTPDRSIVISGDTSKSEAVRRLAQGADVLVHEAMHMDGIDRISARIENATTLRKHLVESHTAVEDCGRIAQEAGVKTLVLSHFVPTDDPLITPEMWRDAAQKHFGGRVIVGRDLMDVPL